MNMYDTIWKITILIMLIYIIYILFKIQDNMKITEKESKNIIYKNFENLTNFESIDDILTENSTIESINDNDIQELSENEIEDQDNNYNINIENDDLKNKNLKDLKIIAKKLNISITNKKKNDILNEILLYK